MARGRSRRRKGEQCRLDCTTACDELRQDRAVRSPGGNDKDTSYYRSSITTDGATSDASHGSSATAFFASCTAPATSGNTYSSCSNNRNSGHCWRGFGVNKASCDVISAATVARWPICTTSAPNTGPDGSTDFGAYGGGANGGPAGKDHNWGGQQLGANADRSSESFVQILPGHFSIANAEQQVQGYGSGGSTSIECETKLHGQELSHASQPKEGSETID